MPEPKSDSLYIAGSVADAVAALADRGSDGAALAGATWAMRAPIRGDRQARSHVAISKIAELRTIEVSDKEVVIGSCVTHAELARRLEPIPELRGLAMAAGSSANPAVRQVATVGGNLCTADFAAADLVPALLCLDAAVEIETSDGSARLAIADFLMRRTSLGSASLVRRIIIPLRPMLSAHARLPLRKAGDYPVAIVSLSIETRRDGTIAAARIGVGSVEAVARRWSRLEEALIGTPRDAILAGEQAQASAGTFTGRDGIDAPSWYRVMVLPTLVRRAFELLDQ